MFGLDYIIFRPHNVYGPRQNIGDRYRNVVGIFMNQILQGQPMTIFGDGTQTRAFSYIDDVAPIMAEAIDRAAAWNQVFNVGADQPCTLNDSPSASRGDGRRRRASSICRRVTRCTRALDPREDAPGVRRRATTPLDDGLARDGGVGEAARRAGQHAVRGHRGDERTCRRAGHSQRPASARPGTSA